MVVILAQPISAGNSHSESLRQRVFCIVSLQISISPVKKRAGYADSLAGSSRGANPSRSGVLRRTSQGQLRDMYLGASALSVMSRASIYQNPHGLEHAQQALQSGENGGRIA